MHALFMSEIQKGQVFLLSGHTPKFTTCLIRRNATGLNETFFQVNTINNVVYALFTQNG